MVKITEDDIGREKLKKKRLLKHIEEIEISDDGKVYHIKRKIRDQRDDEAVEVEE